MWVLHATKTDKSVRYSVNDVSTVSHIKEQQLRTETKPKI